MNRATGVVEGGTIVLPEGVRLPEGARVLVQWEEDRAEYGPPLEREPWTAEEVQREIQWANGWRREP